MSAYLTVTSSRTTSAPVNLLARLRTVLADPTVGVTTLPENRFYLKKATEWSPAQESVALTEINTAPTSTPQVVAQLNVDNFPIEYRALVLALIDALNVIRAALPIPLAAITPAQAIASIRTKAGTL